MQDPDGTAAFCHHHNIMTNVSLNSPKLEEKYRPSCKNELMLQMNKISFAEDNLDSMTTKCQDCVIFVSLRRTIIGLCNDLRLSLV